MRNFWKCAGWFAMVLFCCTFFPHIPEAFGDVSIGSSLTKIAESTKPMDYDSKDQGKFGNTVPGFSIGVPDSESMKMRSGEFPPFFGDSQGQQQNTPENPLIGTWFAASGQRIVQFEFQAGGNCLLTDNGQQCPGTYEVHGNQMILRMSNGKTLTLNFSIQGEFLQFSDGTRMRRQTAQQQIPAQTVPQPQSIQNQSLEGAWAASDGQKTLVMQFMNGMCSLTLNGQNAYGPYTVQGNQLHVQFTNAQPLHIAFTVAGNTLRFADGTVLIRQQNIPPSMPQHSTNQTQLEGTWQTQLPNGATVAFVFRGNQYQVLVNGQRTEEGTFTLRGNRLEYATTFGQQAGQKGTNTWQIQGNVLILMLQNGSMVQLQRS